MIETFILSLAVGCLIGALWSTYSQLRTYKSGYQMLSRLVDRGFSDASDSNKLRYFLMTAFRNDWKLVMPCESDITMALIDEPAESRRSQAQMILDMLLELNSMKEDVRENVFDLPSWSKAVTIQPECNDVHSTST